MKKVRKLIGGLVSRDALKRITTLEKLTEHLLWRLPRSEIERHLESPPALPSELLTDGRLYVDREQMLRALPTAGAAAEVGVWHGDFSKTIDRICRPDVLHLIDIDFSLFTATGFASNTVRHQGDSSTILAGFPAGSLDWAYIDGDHSYEGCRKDLEAAHRAVRPGGFLMCNDYSNWCALSVCPYGVAKAVNEFAARERYRVKGFAFNAGFLPDVLLEKPH